MNNEIKIINAEDNKSEIDNVIMPTGNSLFIKKNINNNNYKLKNIKSKISFSEKISKNLFSNVMLKDFFIENKKKNYYLKSSLYNKAKDISPIGRNKTFRINNKINNICQIKKNCLQFHKKKTTKKKEIFSKKNKISDKRIYKYNDLQKKINNKIQNIKDINCDNNSFSIHYEKKKENFSNLNNNIILQINNRLYSSKNCLINKKKIKNGSLNNNANEIDDFSKMKCASSGFFFTNVLSPQKTKINKSRNSKDFLTPKSCYSKINYFSNFSNSSKIKNKYNIIKSNNKSLLNDYNNISDLFHTKRGYEESKHKSKELNRFAKYNLNKNLNLSHIENNKNENFNNKQFINLDYNSNSRKLIKSSSLLLNKDKISTNKGKRVNSSYFRPNKYNLEYCNSFTQKILLNTRFISLKNYKIKDNIISHILDDIQENKSINNNLVSQLYKRPLINIFTLLELKNNNI